MSDIYGLIPKVMKDIGAITKDGTNSFQNYKFRGIDDVYKSVNPVLVKHGVFCSPEVTETIREQHTTKKGDPIYYTVLNVRYTFYAPDGTNIVASVVGEGMDNSDKSANKAMSAAYKLAFFQVFCIPTEEGSVDSEKDSYQLGKKPAPKTPAPKTPSKALSEKQVKMIYGKLKAKKLTPDDLLKRFQRDSINDFTMGDMANVLLWIEGKFNEYESPVDIDADLFAKKEGE